MNVENKKGFVTTRSENLQLLGGLLTLIFLVILAFDAMSDHMFYHKLIKEPYNAYLDRHCVDPQHNIRFSIDSVTPFISCMVKDFTTTKTWTYTQTELFDGYTAAQLDSLKKHLKITYPFIGGAHIDWHEKQIRDGFTNKTFLITKVQTGNKHYSYYRPENEVNFTSTDYEVYIVVDTNQKMVDLNQHERFYLKNTINKALEDRQVALNIQKEIELRKLQHTQDSLVAIEIKIVTQAKHRSDSLALVEKNKLHDIYFNGCKK